MSSVGASTQGPPSPPVRTAAALADETPSSGTGFVRLPAEDSIRMDCDAEITYPVPVGTSELTARLSAEGSADGSASVVFSAGPGQESTSYVVHPGEFTGPVRYPVEESADSLSVVARCTGGVTGVTLSEPTLVL